MDEATGEAVYFYSKTTAYYELSNFSPHGFELDGAYWPTVEHYFQAQKFPSQPDYQDRIRRAHLPKDAKSLGRSRKVPLRPDWEEVKDDVMRRALRAKFLAHPELMAVLSGTGARELIENAPSDYYWGCGRTGTGKNRLGHLLMELRAALQADAGEAAVKPRNRPRGRSG
jgi:N-glycosidase YbiA